MSRFEIVLLIVLIIMVGVLSYVVHLAQTPQDDLSGTTLMYGDE